MQSSPFPTRTMTAIATAADVRDWLRKSWPSNTRPLTGPSATRAGLLQATLCEQRSSAANSATSARVQLYSMKVSKTMAHVALPRLTTPAHRRLAAFSAPRPMIALSAVLLYIRPMGDLTAWTDFEDIVASAGWTWTGAPGTLSRANSRFRAASCMEVSFPGFQSGSAEGHRDILRAAVAYSAMDALFEGIREHAVQHSSTPMEPTIISHPLAELYRRTEATRLHRMMSDLLTSQTVKSGIDSLRNGVHNDIGPLAKGVRHLAFHGIFAPATIGYRERGALPELFQGIRSETLAATDKHFQEWTSQFTVTAK